MGSTPKRRTRKLKIKKNRELEKELTIEQAFPNTTSSQLEQVQNYYKIGLSANLTSTQPGVPGRDKTFKIFRWLDEDMLKNYDLDANNRQKLGKQKLIGSFERLLLKLEIQLAKVDTVLEHAWKKWQDEVEAKKKLTPPETAKPFDMDTKTERLKLSVLKTISEIRDHMTATDYAMTINERDESAILEHLKKKTESLTSVEVLEE